MIKPQLVSLTALMWLTACADQNIEKDVGNEILKDTQNKQVSDDPITEDNWRSVKHISGRVAVKQDMKEGRAVFFSPTGTSSYDIALPALANHIESETGQKIKVVIVQAEVGPDGPIIGALYFNGDHLLATLAEFEIIEN